MGNKIKLLLILLACILILPLYDDVQRRFFNEYVNVLQCIQGVSSEIWVIPMSLLPPDLKVNESHLTKLS